MYVCIGDRCMGKRELAKVNYRIHTDAIKENLIPKELTSQQTSIINWGFSAEYIAHSN